MDIATDPSRRQSACPESRDSAPGTSESGAAGNRIDRQGRIDWPGLAARFGAAHALRRELAEQPGARTGPAGSFNPAAAQALSRYLHDMSRRRGRLGDGGLGDGDLHHEFHTSALRLPRAHETVRQESFAAVNPIVLADRKSTSGTCEFDADPNASGDRGWK